MQRRGGGAVVVAAVMAAAPAVRAQDVQIPGPNMRATLEAIGNAAGSPPLGSALASGAALEIATAPLASGASGFIYAFDPTTGGFTRGTETFGPAFAQRALTSGKGKLTVGASWNYVKFDEVAGEKLEGFVPFTSNGFGSSIPTRVDLGLKLRSSTLSLFGTVGVFDRLDLGVLLPVTTVSLKSDLTQAFLVGPRGVANSDQSSTGVSDMLVQGKLRLWQSATKAGSTQAPAAAIAAVVAARLPTGSEEDLRGLGFARTKVSGVFSAQAARFAAHFNVGYEFWADQLSFATDIVESDFVKTKNMMEVNAVAEAAITPRITANFDVLMQQVRGAGKLGMDTFTIPAVPSIGFPGLTAVSLVGLGEGLTKFTVAPGIRWNIAGQGLLNAHVLINLKNDSLRAKYTPVIGFEYTF